MNVTPSSRIKRDPGVVAQWTEDTLVLLSLQGGEYYSLNLTGGLAWEKCDGEISVERIAALIGEEFQTDPAVALQDLLALFQQLCDEGLAEIV
jgi:hypothetical protein